MELQKTPNSHSNLDKEKGSSGITIPDFKLYYRTVVIKTVWYWYKNRHQDQENRVKNPKNKPIIMPLINLQHSKKEYPMGKRQLCWENCTATCKK